MGSWLVLKLGCGTAQESCVVDFLVFFLVFFLISLLQIGMKKFLPGQTHRYELKHARKRFYRATIAMLLRNWFLHCFYSVLPDFEYDTHLFGLQTTQGNKNPLFWLIHGTDKALI